MKYIFIALIAATTNSAFAVPNEWNYEPQQASVVRNFTQSLSAMPDTYNRYVSEYESICRTAFVNASHPNSIKLAYRLTEHLTNNTQFNKSGNLVCEIMLIRQSFAR